jgi:hypothetical protein
MTVKKPTTRIEGCIKAGVEAGCIILETPDGHSYSLHGNNIPTLGSGLAASVEGATHDGPDTCQQGTPFDVSSWEWTRMKCPK